MSQEIGFATDAQRSASDQGWSPHRAAALLLHLAFELLDKEEAPTHDEASKAAGLAHAYVFAFADGLKVTEAAFRSTLRKVLDLSDAGIEFHVRAVRAETSTRDARAALATLPEMAVVR